MCGDHDARPTKLTPRFGMQVTGADFWPRPKQVCDLVSGLIGGESFTMFGLRRIGKSSVMAETRTRLTQQGAIVVHVDAQNFKGLAALFSAILAALPQAGVRDRLRHLFVDGKQVAESLAGWVQSVLDGKPGAINAETDANLLAYWSVLAPAVGAKLAENEKPFVLCLDELPMMLQSMLGKPGGVDTANRLLAGLREWRSHPAVAMFLTGSVGIRGLAKEHGLDANLLNDFTEVRLPPLSRDEATLMMKALCAGSTPSLNWPDPILAKVLDQLAAYHPGIIQFAFRRLLAARAATDADVATVFDTDIRQGLESTFFPQFTARLPGPGTDLRRRLDLALALVAACQQPSGLLIGDFAGAFADAGEPTAEVEETIQILQQDGFLDWNTQTRCLSLADGLVRAWWHSRPRA